MKTVHIAIIATAAAVGIVYLATRAARAAADLGPLGLGAAAGSAVVDLGAGAVLGIGDAVGLPRTEMTECERAMAEGRTWDASFVCPAGTFLKYLTS
ncbi:hypothetical protein [Simplicispira suum]|uniref:Uncharacterized protein n=1 Tax=Simplicispira suum TaxID=2109915 RepID=A0A2S0N3K4_9BURK|nr:hypothetical protein [Simplicispira suum]AVO42722.1 hypothetical protein C6571_16750 [Simplicispira suum]